MKGARALSSVALAAVLALAAALSPMPAEPAVPGHVPGQILVKYRQGTSPARASATERGLGAGLHKTLPSLGVRVLRVPEHAASRALAALSRDPSVEFAERDGYAKASDVTPDDAYWPNQWSPVRTRAHKAWELTRGSPSVRIAVLDTGVDGSHPDLQGKIVAGYDFVNNDADPSDDDGHGTWVAGVIGARTNNAIGVASYCWECTIMPVKVLDATGSGSYSDISQGITWAADQGARVINMSFGGRSSSATMASAAGYARDRGAVLIAAAGNDGTSTKAYPAAYPTVVGVAASNSIDQLYGWSNFGQWVDVAAPGSNYSTGLGGTYVVFSGTSSASPVVSGIAGLARDSAPDASAADIEAALRAGAVPIGDAVAYGRVDALSTLHALASPAATAPSLPMPPTWPVEETLPECTITGTPGDDRLIGTSGDDVVCGLAGDDVMYGRGGNDILIGGDGSDRLYGGDGSDRLYGGEGDDALSGGRDDDLLAGEGGNDRLNGGAGADALDGGAGADTVRGGSGDDLLLGGEGSDRLYGNSGADWLDAQAGNDFLAGGSGDDALVGGPGDDDLRGEAGFDSLAGGDGLDTCSRGRDGGVIVSGCEIIRL